MTALQNVDPVSSLTAASSAVVWINGRQSYVNKSGKFVWQPKA